VSIEAESAAAPRTPDRREVQRLATREKVLEISVDEFRRKGFARTDIAAIVERAGVSRGTFYFHFPTKDEVLAELRLREERRIVTDVAPLVSNGEPLEVVLRAVVDGIVVAEDRLGAGLVREMCAVQFRPGVVSSDSVADHPVAELVVAAVAQASAAPAMADSGQGSADLAVIFLTGLFGVLSTHDGPSEQRDRLIDVLIALTLKGVSAP